MENTTQKQIKALKFPAPREVDRYLYSMPYIDTMAGEKEFPSPLEVDRELYIRSEFRNIRKE